MLRKLFGGSGRKHPLEDDAPPSRGNKIERFTQRARRVLSIAQAECERLQHSTIRSEHLLLGILRDESSIGGTALRELISPPEILETGIVELSNAFESSQRKSAPIGSDSDSLISMVEEMAAGSKTVQPRLELAQDTKQALKLAVDEARRMGNRFIGTEHLLLGIIRQQDTIAVQALTRLNVTPAIVRERIRQILADRPRESETPVEERLVAFLSPDGLQNLNLRLVFSKTGDETVYLHSWPLSELRDYLLNLLTQTVQDGKRGKLIEFNVAGGKIEIFVEEEV